MKSIDLKIDDKLKVLTSEYGICSDDLLVQVNCINNTTISLKILKGSWTGRYSEIVRRTDYILVLGKETFTFQIEHNNNYQIY